MPQVFHDHSNLPQTAAVVLVTAAALVLLGFVAAYWTWGMLAPRPAARAQAAADAGGDASAGMLLFGNVKRGGGNAVAASDAIRLLGVVAAAGGRRGYAVVQLDPRQILAVREGEEVVPGVRLAEVGADHVVLDRSGTREKLAWPERGTSTAPAAMPAN